MPVPSGVYHSSSGPSCFDKMKTGFGIGFCVGLASGALFGGFSALRYGLRGRELINNVGKVMLQGGGTFGTFMAIGTGIRC
ncbi:reactive oxygen species modulator 1 [Lutzomyia longipalpis]|uniref:Reactive oxygen species modulator 1 n=1 Tax=Lutzomyia longipalpis TaxID=7200 RepID=A0A1B0CH59_LUTLO|nr:reactive oxygen species modulator 1 [Lutzomyia longipalpis]